MDTKKNSPSTESVSSDRFKYNSLDNPAKSESILLNPPTISLPKGGGALKNIDDKFEVNGANGTLSFSIPVPVTTGRNNFQPSISLMYNSGNGNSVVGLGWSIDFSAIQRKTDKKLPTYRDANDGDVFMFSGSEDLVPLLDKDNAWQLSERRIGKYVVRLYRPRIEGSFSRIERITDTTTGSFYWKITTRDNVVTCYGMSSSCCIADPNDRLKVFKWLPELSYDDKGNCMVFEYKAEDLEKVSNSLHERNRVNGVAKFVNTYLKRVHYGNLQPYFPDFTVVDTLYHPPAPATEYLFEVVFDYGEHSNNGNAEAAKWDIRTDPFSDYRAGFEIRTYRHCKRVMMFHHFTNREFKLANNNNRVPYLVKSLDLEYESSSLHAEQKSEVTYLKSVTYSGYRMQGNGYLKKSLPSRTFGYQELKWSREVKSVSPKDIENVPVGLGSKYQWIDLFNEGISGILSEESDAWYYKFNLGSGEFSRASVVAPKPSISGLTEGAVQIQDLAADGNKQIVFSSPCAKGYFELSDDDAWKPFVPFAQVPTIDPRDPNVKSIDLNGDGVAELIISEEHAFIWYPSKGKLGYDSPELVAKPFDDELGPAIVFADNTQSIFLADMSGDGLTDIVRIRNGEVSFYPNLGYGKFGAKISMSNAPMFDAPDQFNPAYLQLADVSGTGATDIIYLGKNKFTAWLNLSGNSWSAPFEIDPFFNTAQSNQVSVLDLLGNGTSCIVWSSSLPLHANTPLRYIDLMSGRKPHILCWCKNNFGKETKVEYQNSTTFYLADKKAGRPWVTKLPFPVQCVSKVEVIDTVTDLRFVNKYSYHHGYYDHHEREFRGFGMIEQTDTEEYEYLKNVNAANAIDIQFHSPAVLTKSWYHLGAFLRNRKIMDHYKHEYWFNNPSLAPLLVNPENFEQALPDALLPNDLTLDELIEAHRACKGSLLRQEVFSLDGSANEKLPYSVITHNCRITKLQPKKDDAFAVFLVTESESISFAYDRNVKDPRISHTLNISFDDLGGVTKSASVIYPRKERPVDLTDERIWNEQNKSSIILHETDFTYDLITASVYRLRTSYQTRAYEWQGLNPLMNQSYFIISQFNVNPPDIGYEAPFTPNVSQRRLIEHAKAIYLSDDLVTPLPAGTHDTLGLKYESYQLAFTPALLDDIYKPANAPSKLTAQLLNAADYTDLDNDGRLWVRSGKVEFLDVPAGENAIDAAQRFYVPLRYLDPRRAATSVTYYGNYYLFVQRTTDALDNEVIVDEYDFRALFPSRIKDLNGNYSEVAVDALGLVVATAVAGKGEDADDLAGFVADLTEQETTAFFTDPVGNGRNLLKHASMRIVYDFHSIPCATGTIVREEHHRQNANAKLQFGFEYSDGLGNVTLRKIQAEPGLAPHRDANGNWVTTAEGSLDLQHTNTRWVGDGRAILNNKGKPIKQYQPYFCESHYYEAEPEVREVGVTAVLRYDALGRLIRTDFPDDTLSTVEFTPWMQKSFDANDTVKASQWYDDRINRRLDAAFNAERKDPLREKEAAEKAALHDNTPAVHHTDNAGHTFFSVLQNRFRDFVDNTNIIDEFLVTYVAYDVEGNVRSVTDARDNIVMAYKYDMLGNVVYQKSIDAGERWTLQDVMGKPLSQWNSRGNQTTTAYDELHRPVTISVITGNNNMVVERYAYADTRGLTPAQRAAQQQHNLLGKAVVHYDSAGIVRLVRCDFKGNTLETSRELCTNYQSLPDWTNPPDVAVEGEVFVSKSEFDAMNRPVRIFTPHTPQIPATIVLPEYNEANLLEAVKANVRGSQNATVFVSNIDYDEKGQRLSIQFGNNTTTRYTYDSKNFRVIRLLTTRGAGAEILQDLNYTYDPVGNITYQRDHAQQTIFFNNHRVEPHGDYLYDAMYRLIQARGREHIANNQSPSAYDAHRLKLAHKGEGNQLQEYIQRYVYDKTGNMLRMQNVNSWSRTFTYSNGNNQMLTAVANHEVGMAFQYQYDEHGNMRGMPHLPVMAWDIRDHLQRVTITASADNDSAVEAWYVYDTAGQRVRKVVRKNNLIEERIYLDGFEVFRKRQNNALTLQRETVHISDGNKRIALVEHREIGNDNGLQDLIRYQYGNHLGTACLELDGDANGGAIISYEEYYPFGCTSYQAVRNQQETSKRYRFTGKERDEESGLYYHGQRYYAPWLARWTAADPIGIGDGVNVYAFVSNNPVKLQDPTGLAGNPPGNDIGDLFHFLRNQAGFEVGADAAKRGIKYTAQTGGTAMHKQVTNVLGDVQQAGFLDADRIYSEVAIQHNTGVVTQIGGSPIRGHHNLDLVAMPKGQSIALNDVMGTNSAEAVSDIKYGRGKITDAHADFGQQAMTTNGKTTASTPDEVKALLEKTKQTKEELAKGAKFESEAIENSAAVKEYRKAKEAQKALAKEGTEVLEKASKTGAKAGKMAKVVAKLGKAGRHLAAAIPFVGIAAGQASAIHSASQGDYTGAILDEAGFIPVAGDLLDAARGGAALGEALDEGLGISEVATEYGESAEKLAQKAGLSKDTSMYVGATAAAVSSITVAPTQALYRTVKGLFN